MCLRGGGGGWLVLYSVFTLFHITTNSLCLGGLLWSLTVWFPPIHRPSGVHSLWTIDFGSVELGRGAASGMWGREAAAFYTAFLLSFLFQSSYSCPHHLQFQSHLVLPIPCLLRILRCTLLFLSFPHCWPGIRLSVIFRVSRYLSAGFQNYVAGYLLACCSFLLIL